MLIRFSVENFRSIKAPAELSMVAVDANRRETRFVENIDEDLLTVAGIYGANASGKSTVLRAIDWLADAARDSLRGWDESIPIEAFAFGQSRNAVTRFACELAIGGVRHEYKLSLRSSRIEHEELNAFPFRRPRSVFIRIGDEIKFRRGVKGSAPIRQLLTPTTLAISAAASYDAPEINPFRNALRQIQILGPAAGLGLALGYRSREAAELFVTSDVGDVDSDPAIRRVALDLLKLADLGIEDVVVEEEESALMIGSGGRGGLMPIKTLQPYFQHRGSTETERLALSSESAGTQAWFALLPQLLATLDQGGILLMDDIDSSLHPVLSERLIELFKDPVSNPRSAQLIFNSHDVTLLNILNRDEVWFTEKGSDGGTELRALAEYGGDQVRQSSNLERNYLRGRYGAIPNVDRPFELSKSHAS